jgi:chorismate synthase
VAAVTAGAVTAGVVHEVAAAISRRAVILSVIEAMAASAVALVIKAATPDEAATDEAATDEAATDEAAMDEGDTLGEAATAITERTAVGVGEASASGLDSTTRHCPFITPHFGAQTALLITMPTTTTIDGTAASTSMKP